MLKKSLAVALLLAGLGCPLHVRAQQLEIPSKLGAARMPSPVPIGHQHNKPLPPLIPGPLQAVNGPPGPKEDLSLPGNHTSAFQCCEPEVEKFVYFHVGSLSLQREQPGHAVLASVSNTNLSGLDDGLVNLNDTTRVRDIGDITPTHHFGVTATLGVLLGDYSVEVNGFYIPEASDVTQAVSLGLLNSPFINAPLGFVGNNGLFRQADSIRAELTTATGNFEVNTRYAARAYKHIEPIVGVRYFDLAEHLQITVNDDGLSFLGARTQTSVATYSSITENRIIAPQVGMELHTELFTGVSWGLYAKGAIGANVANVRFRLTRGDGLEGLPDAGRNRINLSQLYEAGTTLDVYLLERVRARVGYQIIWAVDVLEVTDQVDFNLANPLGRQDNTGSVYFHGGRIELQFLF